MSLFKETVKLVSSFCDFMQKSNFDPWDEEQLDVLENGMY